RRNLDKRPHAEADPEVWIAHAVAHHIEDRLELTLWIAAWLGSDGADLFGDGRCDAFQESTDQPVLAGEVRVDGHLRGVALVGDAVDAGGESLREEELAGA